MKRLPAVVAALSLLASACSPSPMSLSEYAEEVEVLVRTMNQRIDDGEATAQAEGTLEAARTYANERLASRHDFLDGFASLTPPDEVADLHDAAFDIVTRLAAAESVLVEIVMEAESVAEAAAVWDTPEGEAFRAIDAEARAICAAAQADIDATQHREVFGDTPWIPPEMKEVVEVTLRCTRDDL